MDSKEINLVVDKLSAKINSAANKIKPIAMTVLKEHATSKLLHAGLYLVASVCIIAATTGVVYGMAVLVDLNATQYQFLTPGAVVGRILVVLTILAGVVGSLCCFMEAGENYIAYRTPTHSLISEIL